ncbi:DJ-1/PfpI family protein [Sinorhizobium sp. CB7]|uniref:DJ-1/PfpI family protein n=1 Tax=Sinorhizobium sp. CB7 TaxID=3056949 RepID=UPI00352574A3
MGSGRKSGRHGTYHEPPRRRALLGLLIRTAEKAQWVCSVCEGALLLAAASLLDGYEATTHWNFHA